MVGVLAVPGMASARARRHPAAAHARPRAFASCAQLVGYARHEFARTHGVSEPAVTPLGGTAGGVLPPAGGPAPKEGSGQGSAPAAGPVGSSPTFSTTNNQEPGVDEPDIVKTDGTTIFAVAQNTLYAVDANRHRLAGSLSLGSKGNDAQLLLRGHRLIVISSGFSLPIGLRAPAGGSTKAFFPSGYGGQTVITEVDVSDPGAMKVTRTMTLDGTFVDARQVGSSARLVISSQPQAILDRAMRGRATGWVPMRRFHSRVTGRRFTAPIARCRAIRRPVVFSGLGMLTILTIDLDRGLYATDTEALMADARVVYGSPDSLYIATQKWIDPEMPVNRVPQSQSTVIDKFDVSDPDHTTLVASGEVPGYVLNQFSMSEYNGDLRVATTSRPIWWGEEPPHAVSQSYVTVLRATGGVLVPIGQVSGLGAGQQIYSVRFVGPAGYVVTFRQVDPLYTIDLSDPTAPRVAGKLELEGYSSYLHPLDSDHLLGIGQDVGAGNEPAGSQLELFDVSDPSAPRLLARTSLGDGSYSEALYDHHAFLYWPPTKLAVLPVQIYPPVMGGPVPATGAPVSATPAASGSATTATASSSAQFVGAIGFHIGASGLEEAGRIVHNPVNGYPPPILRSLVIGDTLFTLSDEGVMASNLDTLARESFVTFPQPQTPVVGAPGAAGGAAGGPPRR
jgi:hypothetical protein